MSKYKILFNQETNKSSYFDIERLCWIPHDEEHTDYQAYLAWVAEGNTAGEWTGN